MGKGMMVVIGGPGFGRDKDVSPIKKFQLPKGGGDSGDSGEDYGKSESGPSLMEMGRKRSAEAILRAIEGSDPIALDKALSDHYEACEGGDEPMDDEADKE